jgi:hypothetical protein
MIYIQIDEHKIDTLSLSIDKVMKGHTKKIKAKNNTY